MKKLLAVLLSVCLLLSFAVAACAADIDEARAKEIAYADAGVAAASVRTSYAHIDYDDGVKVWDVEFTVAVTGGYIEYEYEIKALDGSIREKSSERKTGTAPTQGDTIISAETAFAKAQQAFGVSGATLMEAGLDTDDGVRHYEVKFRIGLDAEYSCDVNAYTGEVYDMETETHNDLFSKLAFIFEIIESILESFFKR